MITSPPAASLKNSESTPAPDKNRTIMTPVLSRSTENDPPIATAIVYCEGNFGKIDGKTANGLIRHSEKYKILSVIDSEKTGLDTGMVLDGKQNAIPICRDLADSLAQVESVPDFFIFGMAPASGMLSKYERGLLLEAMSHGMNIVNGLHEFLNDDPVLPLHVSLMR